MVKKSAAASTFQWALRNWLHVVRLPRSGAGSIELLLEDAVLLPEVVDRCVLLACDPSSHGGHEDLPWVEYGRHPLIVAGSAADRRLST